MPGSLFIGTATGTVTWLVHQHIYTTTITLTTGAAYGGGCSKHTGFFSTRVTGSVIANNNPLIEVGGGVGGSICMGPGGVIKKVRYTPALSFG